MTSSPPLIVNVLPELLPLTEKEPISSVPTLITSESLIARFLLKVTVLPKALSQTILRTGDGTPSPDSWSIVVLIYLYTAFWLKFLVVVCTLPPVGPVIDAVIPY